MWLLKLIFGAFASEETLCDYAREYFNVYMDECKKYDVLPYYTTFFWVILGIIILGMVECLSRICLAYIENAVRFWLTHDSFELICELELVCWVILTLGISTTSPPYMLPWIFVKSVYLTLGFILFLLEAAGLVEAEGCTSFRAFKKLIVSAVIYVLVLKKFLRLQEAIVAGKVETYDLIFFEISANRF